ncbi:hypothetical protein BaRGS_00010175 [Batillaria attramentaria]|uniref:Dehydrogenase/reductase SDR family member 11 n=1 Tax=Batillaria attramentaria TaxID=370345 RepID=A0ABD0LGF4_9CAEN
MERWKGRVALVTGASAGIGFAIARALVERGMKVVGCAERDIARIHKLSEELRDKPGSLTAIECDVAKEDQVMTMFQKIRADSKLGHVDVCINNAALAHPAPLLTGEASEWRHMFEVNVLGLLMCTKEAFKTMQEKRIDDGHIIIVSSLAGIRPINDKGLHCYMATKYAVNAIREGLRHELKELKTHIRISQVCPGIVETEFAEHHINKEHAQKLYSSMKCLQPEDVKGAVLYVLDAPPHVEATDIMMRPTDQLH